MSPATVSRALRGVDGVSPDTLARVHSAAEELGYYGKGKVGRQRTKRSIALIVTTQPDGGLFELARRHVLVINQEFAKRGWQLHPVMVPGVGDEGARILDQFIMGESSYGEKIDGCLLIGRFPSGLLPRYHHFLAERFLGNIVMLCAHDVSNGLSGVAMMDYEGGAAAAETLLNAGHQKIGWIGAMGSRDSATRRLGGVYTALRGKGYDTAVEIWMNEREALPNSVVSKIMLENLPPNRVDWPTAWVCSNDWLAAKLIVWARGEGIRIPEDISVVAFDNTQIAEELAEKVITSVVFSYERIARNAVDMLAQLLDGGESDPLVWCVPPKMRAGGTVAPPRGQDSFSREPSVRSSKAKTR